MLREVKLLRELSHSNVVKLYDVFSDWDKKQMHLVFELGTFCVAVLPAVVAVGHEASITVGRGRVSFGEGPRS